MSATADATEAPSAEAKRSGEAPTGNCLFEEPWWLDAVAPGAWGESIVRSGGQTQARMTFGLSGTLGITTLRQPPLTQTLGPWYRNAEGKPATRLAREHELAKELMAGLPRHGFFSVNFHRSVQNWLPYFWQGYTAAPRVTYVLTDLGDEQVLWAQLQENIRREIRKARKQVHVETTEDVELFLRVHQLTFERQGMRLPHDPDVVRRLDAACARRQARQIYLARDEQQRVHAAVYTVFDHRCCYYLMGGGDPALRNSGAGSLLMWQAIQDAGKTSREFDFEGSMGESIERFFRAFGAQQQPFLNVRRAGRILGSAQALRTLIRSLRGG